MEKNEYKCKKCKEIWEFCPEDFDNNKHPTGVCPLCNMPITQMIVDVYKVDGIAEVIRRIFIRLEKKLTKLT